MSLRSEIEERNEKARKDWHLRRICGGPYPSPFVSEHQEQFWEAWYLLRRRRARLFVMMLGAKRKRGRVLDLIYGKLRKAYD